jgi:lipopolysaccharide export system protein LptC
MLYKMMYKNTLISVIMTAAIALAAWMTLSSYHPSFSLLDKTNFLPDAFMEEATAIIMDKQGNPKIKITSPKIIHYSHHDTTYFTSPQLTLYRELPTPWYVSSQYAKATQGVGHLEFWQNVVIHQYADENHPDTLIQTATLTVHTQQQTADTADPITLIQPNLTIKAIGMHTDINVGSIKLLSNARGEYVPSS